MPVYQLHSVLVVCLIAGLCATGSEAKITKFRCCSAPWQHVQAERCCPLSDTVDTQKPSHNCWTTRQTEGQCGVVAELLLLLTPSRPFEGVAQGQSCKTAQPADFLSSAACASVLKPPSSSFTSPVQPTQRLRVQGNLVRTMETQGEDVNSIQEGQGRNQSHGVSAEGGMERGMDRWKDGKIDG